MLRMFLKHNIDETLSSVAKQYNKKKRMLKCMAVALECISPQMTQKAPCLIKLTPVTPKIYRQLIFHFINGHMANEY